MGRHFLMDRHRWTMAAPHHFEPWERAKQDVLDIESDLLANALD